MSLNHTIGDSIKADQMLAALASVETNNYNLWAVAHGKGVDVKVAFPVEFKAVLAEFCAKRKQTQADFIRVAAMEALTRDLTAISRGEVAK